MGVFPGGVCIVLPVLYIGVCTAYGEMCILVLEVCVHVYYILCVCSHLSTSVQSSAWCVQLEFCVDAGKKGVMCILALVRYICRHWSGLYADVFRVQASLCVYGVYAGDCGVVGAL